MQLLTVLENEHYNPSYKLFRPSTGKLFFCKLKRIASIGKLSSRSLTSGKL
jgi:hypothetical protein